MKKILLFAGTTEGRLLTEYLIQQPVLLHVCVTTDYGRDLLPAAPNLTISARKMDVDEMTAFMEQSHFDLVLDATHPYAAEATEHIRQACGRTRTPYQRILRDGHTAPADGQHAHPGISQAGAHMVADITEAVAFLSEKSGPVFLTTGSKHLPDFMCLPHAADRLFIRILPQPSILEACRELGLAPSHIFCMQGPFDTDMNLACIRHIQRIWQREHLQGDSGKAAVSADLSGPLSDSQTSLCMVTKQSGKNGGFDEKMSAAAQANIALLVIGQPKAVPGLSLSKSYDWLQTWTQTASEGPSAADAALHATPATADSTHHEASPQPRRVTLIGAGMSARQLTQEADEALRSCDVIIGARRMLDMAACYGKPTYCSYNYPAITDYMLGHPDYRHFAVLFSGDVGFYSGAASLRRCLEGHSFDIRTISGIASPVHFLNAIGKPWEDVRLISCHGQEAAVISHIRRHRGTLILLGKPSDAAGICRQLIRYHLEDAYVAIGSNLQQPDEQILQGSPADFTDTVCAALSLIYVENPGAAAAVVTHGLPDDCFLRGQVPMTKSEVRSVILSKLQLTDRAIVYDIGAGTGSIAIEAARQIPCGHVWAIERQPAGTALIEQNRLRLQADNLSVIEGSAPEALRNLPPATHAFIGGSAGRLADILRLLYDKNPQVRIVLTAITLETIGELIRLQKKMALPEPEIVQLQVSRAKKTGSYHLMQGQNPVYIITLQPDSSCLQNL